MFGGSSSDKKTYAPQIPAQSKSQVKAKTATKEIGGVTITTAPGGTGMSDAKEKLPEPQIPSYGDPSPPKS